MVVVEVGRRLHLAYIPETGDEDVLPCPCNFLFFFFFGCTLAYYVDHASKYNILPLSLVTSSQHTLLKIHVYRSLDLSWCKK